MTKQVIFKKLTIQNFLSIGNDPVEILFRSGLHIITGTNRDQSDRRNGIGKSTILDGLSFVLFGSTLRELKKEFIINNITKKTSKVSLEFAICENGSARNYELHRTIEPNKCFLYEDGIDITRDSMVNTTDFVQQSLKLTPEVFQNCIAMTINSTTPFMAKKKIEKRKFIESIFNLEVFSSMNSNLKLEYNEAKKDFDISNTKLEVARSYLTNAQQQIENKIKEKANSKNILLDRRNKTVCEIDATSGKLEKFQTLDLTSVESKIQDAEVRYCEIIDKINVVGKDITSVETKKNFTASALSKIGTNKDTCPVCLKTVTMCDKEHIDKKKNDYNLEINKYDKEITELEEKIQIYDESKNKLGSAISKLKDIVNKQKIQLENKKHLNQKIKYLTEQKDTIDKDIESLDKLTEDSNVALEDHKKRIDDYLKDVELKRDNINLLDVVKFVLGEDGVRSYIVKKILQLFNNKLSYYLRRLSSNAFIKFDEYFEETIVNEKGVPVCYFNFSGAEKKVIDLAIMFTFIEMLRMQGNVIYNVQFYDELLDTSLDEAGVEMVVALLIDLVAQFDSGIYVISHRKECSKLSTGDVIFLEKKSGITRKTTLKES